MPDGPGESADVWRRLFPRGLELWVAESDGACAAAYAASEDDTLENRTRIVVGDQGNPTDLDRWLAESGGDFDAVIDDGGHRNSLINASFYALWPALKPGGVYFIEDLSVGRAKGFDDADFVMADVMGVWIDQLLITERLDERTWGPQPTYAATEGRRRRFPLPDDVAFVHCGPNVCALGKSRRPGIRVAFPGLDVKFRAGY